MQIGKIYAIPIAVTSKYEYDTKLNVNDTVVFHHFVCQPDHKMSFGENVYRSEYFHLYAKIENEKVMPIEDVIFVEPILEDESNMFIGSIRLKPHREYLKQQGVVFAASKRAQSKGVLPGDKVYFTKDADYPMNISGAGLYRMRIRNIIALERNGELTCLSDKLIVKEIKEENKVGILIGGKNQRQLKGEVMLVGKEVKGVKEGEVINYFNGLTGSIIKDGEVYSFVDVRNINYIIN
ncbi:MAG TPA: hypothetical protein VEA37_13425 [Flavobacterium sp.]|nr:hypothetical protein [Flavobacterium sp.]